MDPGVTVAHAERYVAVQELMWYDEVLPAELRSGPITSFADRYQLYSSCICLLVVRESNAIKRFF